MISSIWLTLSLALTQQFFASNFQWEVADRFVPDLHQVHIPIGFDNNDVSQIIVDVEFRDTCEEFGRAVVFPHDEHTNVLMLQVEARRRDGFCLPVINRQPKIVDIGVLPVNDEGYRIVDFKSLDVTYGKLRVRQARSSKIDDNNYAPVDSLIVREEPNGLRRSIEISGSFMDTCMYFKNISVGKTGDNLIEVLPIVDRVNSPNCEKRPVLFNQVVEIPQREGELRVNTGRYVFYVRTMNGGSLVKADYLVYE